VPVIISDGWVPARDIDWASCSLRVSESDIDSIPSLCATNVGRAREMGLLARQEWEAHCSLGEPSVGSDAGCGSCAKRIANAGSIRRLISSAIWPSDVNSCAMDADVSARRFAGHGLR
jgi:hypothetical protein